MFGFDRNRPTRRRSAIRNRGNAASWWRQLRSEGILPSLAIAGVFFVGLTALFLLRAQVVPYRPGEYVAHDITARVGFEFYDKDLHSRQVERARELAPHVYQQSAEDIWNIVENELLALPDLAHNQQLQPEVKSILDNGALTILEQDRTGIDRDRYDENVRAFIAYARQNLMPDHGPLVILPEADWLNETRSSAMQPDMRRTILLEPPTPDVDTPHAAPMTQLRQIDPATQAYPSQLPDAVLARLDKFAEGFELGLGSKIARIVALELSSHPDYTYDDSATVREKNLLADQVDPADANWTYVKDSTIVQQGVLSDHDFQILRAENEAYHHALTSSFSGRWKYRAGLAGVALILTILLSSYVARYQARCLRNHTRGFAIVALLLSMLLLTQLAGIGTSSLYIFGIAPTILAAMILTVAYDQRFALGVASIHTLIVTACLDQGLGFFLIAWVGVLTACYALDDIRTRIKLIEVGGVAAIAMILTAAAVGAAQLEPRPLIFLNCLYVGAAGLAAGFVVLGILPFIEKTFRITTSMTLLELADVSQPLLRRLALEAPGTYNHSLQVATLAEAAAEAIQANSLLCRVGSYYHDIGKINKPDYFVENQMGGENRHLNLTPSLSLRIILSHVKDGVEMAKEYNLPTSILPIIQQHHGTTLVEYFYREAVKQGDMQPEAGPRLSDTEFRYPGPKPKSKEAAIVMICDAVESACRCLAEPTASRLEARVHELALARLQDGQFDECDLTFRDLQRVEQTLAKALLGIYHGRIAYPTASPTPAPAITPAFKTA